MRTIGIRVSPKAVFYVVYDSHASRIVNIDKIKVPAALETPETLKYIRNNILDILREFEISRAGIRTTESSSQNKSIERIQIEGVIQETFASSLLKKYFTGQIAVIAARLGMNRADFKKYVDDEIQYEAVENWNELEKEEREAVFAAIGAAND